MYLESGEGKKARLRAVWLLGGIVCLSVSVNAQSPLGLTFKVGAFPTHWYQDFSQREASIDKGGLWTAGVGMEAHLVGPFSVEMSGLYRNFQVEWGSSYVTFSASRDKGYGLEFPIVGK